MSNEGKRFEQDFIGSVPAEWFKYRLNDSSASWSNNENSRFTPSNICDFIVYNGFYQSLSLAFTGWVNISSNLVVSKDLTVSGVKACLQTTEHYGKRVINTYETAEYYFGDIGRSTVISGTCIVPIEDIFKECVNTEIDYEVFLTKYGKGDIWVDSMNKDSFIVKGDDIPFGWEVKAKRKGYENDRLIERKQT